MKFFPLEQRSCVMSCHNLFQICPNLGALSLIPLKNRKISRAQLLVAWNWILISVKKSLRVLIF
jgi:hypothetical protein